MNWLIVIPAALVVLMVGLLVWGLCRAAANGDEQMEHAFSERRYGSDLELRIAGVISPEEYVRRVEARIAEREQTR